MNETFYTRARKSLQGGNEWPFRVKGDFVEWFSLRELVWLTPEGVPDEHGYRMMNWKLPNGKRRFLRLHNVVWETHNGPVPEGLEIDHIDMDKSNNRITNLRLLSHGDNIRAAREKLGNWSKSKLLPHQIELVLALSAALPKGQGPLLPLAKRWGVSKFYLGNLRAKAKKENDPRYLAGL